MTFQVELILAAEMQASLDELRRLTDAAGRDFDALTISYKAPLYDVTQAGELEKQVGLERRPFSGTTGEIVEDIAAYSGLGVSELIFDIRAETLGQSLERMEHVATEIIPAAAASA